MPIKIVNSYVIKIENGHLKGVVKYKYFEQIIPDEFKILKQQMSYLLLEKFEIELEGNTYNNPQLKRNIEEYAKYDNILQKECLRYFDRLEKSPSQSIEITQDTIESNPTYVESIAEKVWTGQI